MSTKQLVTIGQQWERKRGHASWPLSLTIRQVYRADRQVRTTDGRMVTFTDLRKHYRLFGA